jgi:HEPN domain-containing protein
MNRRELQQLTDIRLLDAKALLRAKRYDGAYYLAGYAVECAIKACIARKTRRHDFPPQDTRDLYTHDLEKLLKAADLSGPFAIEREADLLLDSYWDVVKDWRPGDSRYIVRASKVAWAKAQALIVAVEDGQHGVLQCLSKYW